MYKAIECGASKHTPIVVCSYGSLLDEPVWQEPLQTWASGCEAPVLICGVSGKGDEVEKGDSSDCYGGGGSGVFWPDGKRPQQRKRRGIYCIDTEQRKINHIKIAIKI